MSEHRPCTGPDADLWTSDDAADRLEAAKMCAACPVVEQCRDDALANKERWSVYGGVDFSFTSTSSGFTCGVVTACNRQVEGLGRRGEHVVPACDTHVYRAPKVVVLQPVVQPPRETARERAERLAEVVREGHKLGWSDARILDHLGVTATALSRLFYRQGMTAEVLEFRHLVEGRRRAS